MARIIYALSGQGRGHASRVMAVSDALRARGHEIVFCCGGTSRDILTMKDEAVIEVPSLRQVMEGNKVCIFQTVHANWDSIVHLDRIVTDLADTFAIVDPDLVITDFEAFSHRAADRLGVPVVSFNHQQIVTETRYRLDWQYRWGAGLTGLVIRLIVPPSPELTLITSFFYPPLRRPDRVKLVPPIIRPAVQNLVPTRGEHILVYYNHTDGAEHVLRTLRNVDAPFVAYNFDPPGGGHRYPNVRFKEPCIDEFLSDLASSRGVISTAGFTLTSETLFLGKPLLVVPNRGIFEQTLNALFLKREGLGEAVIDRPLTEEDVTSFLDGHSTFEERLEAHATCGNDHAVEAIEGVLSRHTAVSTPPRARKRDASAAGVTPSTGRFD
ncbi:MAG: glycosyltransferase family protein [Rhodothermales bacterium]